MSTHYHIDDYYSLREETKLVNRFLCQFGNSKCFKNNLFNNIDKHFTQPEHEDKSVSDQKLIEKILEKLPCGVLVINSLGTIEVINKQANEILGKNLLGKNWNKSIKDLFTPQFDDGHEVTLWNKNKISIFTAPICENKKQLLVISDHTKTRKLQDELSKYKRLAGFGNLMSEISHQVKTPIGTSIIMLSNLKMLLRGEKEMGYVEEINQQLIDLNNYINDMLYYIKNGSITKSTVSTSLFIEECTQSLLSLENNISIKTNFRNSALLIECNKTLLINAIINVLNNSIEAHSSVDEIEIVFSANDKYFIIQVIDKGIGIERKNINKIFNRFFTTKSEGNGLGLGIVRAIVNSHDGDIEISSGKRKGTIVTIKLPLLLQVIK